VLPHAPAALFEPVVDGGRQDGRWKRHHPQDRHRLTEPKGSPRAPWPPSSPAPHRSAR
jgi:hypothetical protein